MKSLPIKYQSPLGLLNNALEKGNVQHLRFHVSPPLSLFIEHYWYVSWDLRAGAGQRDDEDLSQKILTHPSVHVSMENQQARLYGVQSKVFVRRLSGQSQVLGIKFKPAGFYPYFNNSLHLLSNKIVDFSELNDNAFSEIVTQCSCQLAQTAAASPAIATLVQQLDRQLARAVPDVDDKLLSDMQRVEELIGVIKDTPRFKVADLCQQVNLSQRQAQRLCQKLVGVTPKWLVNRYRMHWIAEELKHGDTEWSRFVEHFGYSDQAHFINDFKKHIGNTPGDYVKALYV